MQTCQRELCRPAKENYAEWAKRTMQTCQRELCRMGNNENDADSANENYADSANDYCASGKMKIMQIGRRK